jgi:hypothetical protein
MRRHQWVYKLDADDKDGNHLFTLVTPSVVCKPDERQRQIEISGTSREIRKYFEEIGQIVRRGAGEYRV